MSALQDYSNSIKITERAFDVQEIQNIGYVYLDKAYLNTLAVKAYYYLLLIKGVVGIGKQ